MPDLQESLRIFSILALPFFFGITCHEVAHGYVSYLLGDPTAKNAGRLTLNPLCHLDALGILALLVAHIGWAKPVPINPAYYRDYRKGIFYVSLAGPAANIAVMLLFAVLYKLTLLLHTALPPVIFRPLVNITAAGIYLNAMLAVFNLLPIPPLDGSKMLACFLPGRVAVPYMRIERYGFLILLALAWGGVLQEILPPLTNWLSKPFL